MSAGEGSDTGISQLVRLAPSVGVLVALAGAAALAAGFIPGVNVLLLGMLFGAIVANMVGVPDWVRPGIDAQKLLLETGIILLGARIAIDELVTSGPVLIGLIVVTVAAGVLLAEAAARCVFDLADKVGSLLVASASVCGVSAATATVGTTNADGESLTHVVATVLLFDTFTLAAFPITDNLLPLSDRQFGIWVGLSTLSTSSVTAAGFTHPEVAGRWTAVAELVRSSTLGFVAVTYMGHYANCVEEVSAGLRAVFDDAPRLLVGFIVIAAIANLGLLSDVTLVIIGTTSDALFAFAFIDLGLDVRLDAVRRTGTIPFTALGVQLPAVSTLAFAAVLALF